MPKRKVEDVCQTDENAPPSQPPVPGLNVSNLVKRLRALENENAHLKERVVVSEATVHQLTEQLSARRPATRPAATPCQLAEFEKQQRMQRFHAHRRQRQAAMSRKANLHTQRTQRTQRTAPAPSARPTSARGTVRQRINSPKQFYLTLLAMYCSAFARVMHGPGSANPILSRADAEELERQCAAHISATKAQLNSDEINATSKNSSSSICSHHFTAHGTASAEADMASQKYERMLRASSQGLLRLIQFRRKLVRERQRSRRAGLSGSAQCKVGGRFDLDDLHN